MQHLSEQEPLVGFQSWVPDTLDQARKNMISQQIRPWDVLEPRILEALETYPRHVFVPEKTKNLAYVDMEIPLPEGQVMLAPKVEARILQELDLKNTDEVLEIGSGSGYFACLLGHFARSVLSIEKYPSLVSLAQSRVALSQSGSVNIVQGNGLKEDPRWSHRLFDAMVISGGVYKVPPHLFSLLKPGGRLIGLVGLAPVMQAILYEKTAESLRQTSLFDTLTQPLEDQPLQPDFAF